jgi:hypothetical protein
VGDGYDHDARALQVVVNWLEKLKARVPTKYRALTRKRPWDFDTGS